MSKMNRQRREEGRTELPERTGSPQTEDQPSPATIELEPRKDLVKVMTDELTPLCPFCKSPKLRPITTPNPWGRKWVCGNCCSAFREPIRRKLA